MKRCFKRAYLGNMPSQRYITAPAVLLLAPVVGTHAGCRHLTARYTMNTNEIRSFAEETPNKSTAVTTNDSNIEPEAISSVDVTVALNAILGVDKFAASPQMSAFLKYVVEQTLLGNTRRIKAFTVGLEALGKSASFDPQTDPSVRVLAKRLRSSLDTYYLQHPDTRIIIEMKPGSYVPKFLIRSPAEVQHSGTAATIAVPATSTLGTPASSILPASNNHTHLSINQPVKFVGESNPKHAESSAVTSTTADTLETRESGIQRLWNAYKSTSKVA